jgi:D-3-phosphoglycerate dehydrogenase / 2-oxoglutarate reductase
MRAASDATVLVTPRSFREASAEAVALLERSVGEVRYSDLGRALTSAELRSALADVDGLIAGLDELDAQAIDAAPRLRAIARYGVGTDRVDLEAAARRGVTVTITPSANATAVAEHALALMLALLRRLPEAERRARAGDWRPPGGDQLAGRTVGLLGLGRIGREVALRARGMACPVVANDPQADRGFTEAHRVRLAARDEVVARCDVLSLHLPLTDETRDLVDRRLLGSMRRGSFLVNTARGELVVEEDLLRALEAGRLRGAALDVLRSEPPPPDHPLLARDDVLVTPHAAAQTAEARAAMARGAVGELLAVLSGEPPRFPVVSPATEAAR